MKGSLVIGKIRGIQIEINVSWLIIFGLVTYMLATSYFPQYYPGWSIALRWGLGSIIALMMFVSVLLHELSHSLVSANVGIPVHKISLFIFGGIAQMEGEPDEPLKELKIATAGPAMSIFLFLFFMLLARIAGLMGASEFVVVPLSYLSTVNLVLAIFNLVPAFPLDGGRVLRALIWHFNGNLKNATQIASSSGRVFGYFLIFVGTFWVLTGYVVNGIWFIFIGWFITQAAQSSYQDMLMSNIFNKIHVSDLMTDQVVTVSYHSSVQELVENYFYKYKFSSFPVIQNEQLIGMVNLDNAKKIPQDKWSQTTVGTITTLLNDSLIIAPNDTVSAAMAKLFSNGIGRALVMDQTKLIGILSRTDILNYIRIHGQLDSKY